MGVRQGQQAHDRAQTNRTFVFHHSSGPPATGFSHGRGAFLPIGQLARQRTVSTAQAQALAELAPFQAPVQGDLFPA